jgi:protein-tyrosine-phosphatase
LTPREKIVNMTNGSLRDIHTMCANALSELGVLVGRELIGREVIDPIYQVQDELLEEANKRGLSLEVKKYGEN